MKSLHRWAIGLGALGCIGLTGCGGSVDSDSTARPLAAIELGDLSQSDTGISAELLSMELDCHGPAQDLQPIVNCVAPDGEGKLVAHFGYVNPQGSAITIPVGPHNKFTPPPFDRGQPTILAPGESDNVVSVAFDAQRGAPQWKLGEAHADASTHSPPCVPTFAGATSATVLSESEITLAWAAATDFTTPSSDIVYDICVSTIPGSCATNFVVAQTSAVGETSSTVTGLMANTSYFFVVRARNAVGNEGTNTVEVGAQTCVTGDVACNGTCASLASDPANCGMCGNACVNEDCIDGLCRAPLFFIAVAAGQAHTCGIISDHRVVCWGYNYYGQLGNGGTSDEETPVEAAGIANANAIAGAYQHTCAVLGDGKARCWGRISHVLGDGQWHWDFANVEVSGMTNAISVTAHDLDHTCVLRSDGRISCWGDSQGGVLGDGTVSDGSWGERQTPREVGGIANAVAVSTGQAHTCALLDDGTVLCWGFNHSGQLGDGTTTTRLAPVQVTGVTGEVTAITTGSFHSCVVLSNGKVLCWGYNQYGQLGNGSTSESPVPVEVAGVNSAVAVGAGFSHTCAVLADGKVKCWGCYDDGSIGHCLWNGTAIPMDVTGVTEAVAISAGEGHTCALLRNGKVQCWGANRFGQLGNGTQVDSSTPVAVVW